MEFIKYEKYKDSGLQWLGEIPEDWKAKRLKNIAFLSFSNVDKKTYEGQQEIYLCNYVDVYNNDFITSSIDFMKATANYDEIKKFKIKKYDVLSSPTK